MSVNRSMALVEEATRRAITGGAFNSSRPKIAPETRKPSTIPGQLAQRQKDKFVPLPSSLLATEDEEPEMLHDEEAIKLSISPFAAYADESSALASSPRAPIPSTSRGRITVYCVSEALNRKSLTNAIKAKYGPQAIHTYIDAVHLRMGMDSATYADCFFFDYGCLVFWGHDQEKEKELVDEVYKIFQVKPYPAHEVEIDDFQFNFSVSEVPGIQNDIFTIHKRQAADHQVRLAMSHALAQSAKLSVYEERVSELVEETKHLPFALANEGKVKISSKQIAQLIGKVFLQTSTLNLLSTVLDTPEYFWDVPDSHQALYERACEYLELPTRIEVLNARLQVLQEMLDMLRNHQNHDHDLRIEWFVIWLLVIDTVLMIFQLGGLFGFLN